jgi:hypothetical protein
MPRTGRPAIAHPRDRGLFIRLADAEFGSAMEAEHPVTDRRPTLSEWARELLVAHASEVLAVTVTRAGLRHQPGGVPEWKRWRLARAVRLAARRRRRRR